MPQFGQQDVEVLHREPVYQGFFKTTVLQLRHRLFQGGWSPVIKRELVDRGHAVAVLPYDPERDQIVTLEQFRVGALATSTTPWLIELVAGMVDAGETAAAVARRELQEEAGLTATELTRATSYLSSPGGLTERITIYMARVDASRAVDFGGLASESEDIKVRVLPRTEVLQLLSDGHIDNAASVIGLQWLALNLSQLRQSWGVESL